MNTTITVVIPWIGSPVLQLTMADPVKVMLVLLFLWHVTFTIEMTLIDSMALMHAFITNGMICLLQMTQVYIFSWAS